MPHYLTFSPVGGSLNMEELLRMEQFFSICRGESIIKDVDDDEQDTQQGPTSGQPPESSLLNLPPETRDCIWRFSLIDDERIALERDLEQPPLLRVCRMIRREALDIWYSDNTFFVSVRDCDDTLLNAFASHILDLGVDVNVKGEIRGGKEWSNLLIWCRHIYDRHSMYLVKTKTEGRRASIISAAHEIVLRHRHRYLCWDECERALENLRTVIEKLDPEWS